MEIDKAGNRTLKIECKRSQFKQEFAGLAAAVG
jgi:hypothetical protein